MGAHLVPFACFSILLTTPPAWHPSDSAAAKRQHSRWLAEIDNIQRFSAVATFRAVDDCGDVKACDIAMRWRKKPLSLYARVVTPTRFGGTELLWSARENKNRVLAHSPPRGTFSVGPMWFAPDSAVVRKVVPVRVDSMDFRSIIQNTWQQVRHEDSTRFELARYAGTSHYHLKVRQETDDGHAIVITFLHRDQLGFPTHIRVSKTSNQGGRITQVVWSVAFDNVNTSPTFDDLTFSLRNAEYGLCHLGKRRVASEEDLPLGKTPATGQKARVQKKKETDE